MTFLRPAISLFLPLWLSLAAILSAPPANAQSDAMMEAFNRYKVLNEQGRYAEAKPFARKAPESARK